MLYEITVRREVEQTVKVLVELPATGSTDPEHEAEDIAMNALTANAAGRDVSIGTPYDVTQTGDMTVLDTKLLHV